MKHFMTMLLSIVLMIFCCSTAFATEDFTLRNGIKFGDTIEEIVAKETTLTRRSKESNWFDGNIEGYSNAQCRFNFDNDGKLEDMLYFFDTKICTSRDETNDIYKKLYDMLEHQYGAPLGNTGGKLYLITGEAFNEFLSACKSTEDSIDWNTEYIDYDEWVVDCDGYHVKIDQISFYFDNWGSYKLYFLLLSYHYYTDEDYNAALHEKQDEQQEVDDDL